MTLISTAVHFAGECFSQCVLLPCWKINLILKIYLTANSRAHPLGCHCGLGMIGHTTGLTSGKDRAVADIAVEASTTRAYWRVILAISSCQRGHIGSAEGLRKCAAPSEARKMDCASLMASCAFVRAPRLFEMGVNPD